MFGYYSEFTSYSENRKPIFFEAGGCAIRPAIYDFLPFSVAVVYAMTCTYIYYIRIRSRPLSLLPTIFVYVVTFVALALRCY